MTKRPESLRQIHAKEGNADHAEGCFREMGHDAVQSVGALAGSEFAFHDVPVTDILVFLAFGGASLFCVHRGTAQGGAGELNAAFLAPSDGFPVPVNLVRQHPRRIETVAFPVAFHGPEEIAGLVESIEGEPLNPGISVHHADMKLRAEFRVGMRLPTDDRPHPRLTDADDPVRHAAHPVLVHVQLLLVERGERVQQIVDRLVKPDAFVLDEVRDVPDIAADELQLLLDAFSDGLGGTFLALGQVQESLSRNPRVHSGCLPAIGLADLPDDVLQQFPGVIQELEVLREGNVSRAAGRVHDQRSAVRRCLRLGLSCILSAAPARLSLVVMILAGFLGNAGLQNRRNSLRRKALAELHHGGCPKGSLRAVCFHPQKELEVWVFAHMPHRPLVAALQPLLDDERSQRDSRRMRRMPVVHKLLCVLTLHCLPGNQARQLDPFILRIQFPERKNKVLERQLDLLLVHPSSLQCKLFVGSSRFFLHLYYTILGAKTLAFLCFWCFGADS